MINYYKKNLTEYLIGIFLVIILSIYYYFHHIQQHKFKYAMDQHDQLYSLLLLDDQLNSFIEKRFEIIVFDDINQVLSQFHVTLEELLKNEKENKISQIYQDYLNKILTSFQTKEFLIERIKYQKAFETNILFSMMEIENSYFSKLPLQKQQYIYKAKLEFINMLVNKETHKAPELINSYRSVKGLDNYYWNTFLIRANAMVNSIESQEKNYQRLSNIELQENINDAEEILHELIHEKELFSTAIEFLLWSIILLLSLLLIYFYRNLKNTNLELSAFKSAVENSYNVVIITDQNMLITYVNDLFEKVTGYSKENVIGKNPRLLKSNLQDDAFYQNLYNTIKSGEKWEGRFINKDKNDNLFYEDATITPIIDRNNNIKGYLSIKRDVTQNVKNEKLLEELNSNLQEEINKQVQEISEKEKELLEQRKLASMGEMLGNIAHQWRQPLAGISATLLNIDSKIFAIKAVEGITKDEQLNNFFKFIENKNDKIRNYVHHLSDTIDIFRDFIKSDKKYSKCNLQELIDETLSVVDAALKNNFIELINNTQNEENIRVTIIKGELSQVIINIINNSRDAIQEKNIQKPWIKIDLIKKENSAIISIEDNAGGIPESIQSKIFDPYFTTKHQSQGTGLGLHMSYKIITESLHGKLYTVNTEHGAKFFIQLPLK